MKEQKGTKNTNTNTESTEFNSLNNAIKEIKVPQPKEQMKENFLNGLERIHTEEKLKRSSVLSYIPEYMKIAATILLFASGFILGILVKNYTSGNDAVVTELQNTQKLLMLTLLEQSSATDRLKAVNISYQINESDQKIAEALLTTLNNDPNVNVRLSCIDALLAISNNPNVRIGLIESINNQESPLIQSALADAMVTLSEKRSVEQLQKLLEQNHLNDNVKRKIQESIQTLTKI